MVKRTVKGDDQEPEQKMFDLPSEKEHLLQVTEVYDIDNNEFGFDLGPNDVVARLEVAGGEEEGRSLLNRMSIDDKWKGFFATRQFLKAIGEPYKGDTFPIDSDNWTGRQFYATVVHNKAKNGKVYANIKEFNLEKLVDNSSAPKKETEVQQPQSDEVAWDD